VGILLFILLGFVVSIVVGTIFVLFIETGKKRRWLEFKHYDRYHSDEEESEFERLQEDSILNHNERTKPQDFEDDEPF